MKGKGARHLPPDEPKRKKSKPHQQAPPLDAVKDFDTPVRKEPEQQTLPGAEAEPEETPQVVNDYIAAKFVRPHPERDKDGKAFIGFEISFPLIEEHREKKLLPERILRAWQIISEEGYPNLSIDGIPAQTVELAIAPDAIEKHTALKLPFAEIENATISVIEETGAGEAVKVSRLKFRATVELDVQNWRWAGQHFQQTVWVKLQTVQGSLLEEAA